MTKYEAQREAQRLFEEAYALVSQAQSLMDEHRFSMDFMEKEYCPKNLTEDEIEDGQLPYAYGWMSVGDGGVWLSSSDKC
jgi:hypothetical protein